MKKIVLSLVALFAIGNVFSQGIAFEQGSFEEALTKAKKENKPIFMGCYTEWCRPCKHLAKYVFTKEEVGTFFNKNFVNVKMDMESDAGKPLMGKYNVQAFPTLLWLDTDGNIQHKIVGAGGVEDLMKSAKLALDNENNLKAFLNRLKKGERSSDFLRKYIHMASRAGENLKEASDLYFSTKRKKELVNPEDLELIKLVASSTSDSLFLFVVENKAEFYAIGLKDEVNQYLTYIMTNEIYASLKDLDEKVLNQKKKELLALDKELATKIAAYGDVLLLGSTAKNVNEYYRAFIAYTKEFETNNSSALVTPAWQIANAKEDIDKEIINQSIELLELSLKLEHTAFNHDVYAQLMDKTGHNDKAKEYAKKAIELASEKDKERMWSIGFLKDK